MESFQDFLRLLNRSTSTLAATVRKWMDDPLLKSTTIDIEISVGSSTGSGPHGLQRVYNGAFVIGCSAAYPVVVSLPGSDASTTVHVEASSIVTSVPLTVRLKVF